MSKELSKELQSVGVVANEIVLYKPNDQMTLEVKLENDTVWLTQQ